MLKADPVLLTAVQTLKEEFNPLRLFLFGSRANGTATADSDYDFVMVVKELKPEDQLKEMHRARIVLASHFIDADIFIYSPSKFEEMSEQFSSIPEIALSDGHELDLNE